MPSSPHQLKVILEGTIVLEDADTGTKLEGRPGDIINSASLSFLRLDLASH